MWDLIVSVPDHCLSFYFAGSTNKTLYKFEYYGLSSGSWKTQKVVIDGVCSDPAPVLSDVPQVLNGTYILLAFINDLKDNINSTVSLFVNNRNNNNNNSNNFISRG